VSLAEPASFSVVICAFTERRWSALCAAIRAVERQTQPPLETVVVVDHNPRLLARVRQEFPEVVSTASEGPQGPGSARNIGVQMSHGDVIAFLDDDAEPAETWLEELARAHSGRAILGVGGRIDPRWEAGRPSWFPDEFLWVVGCDYRGLPARVAPIRNPISANMSVGRDAFLSVDGFRAGFGKKGAKGGSDETELCIRISLANPSLQWLYWPTAKVYHQVPAERTSLRYFVSRCYQEGVVKAELTPIAGGATALSSERAYLVRVLPIGFASKLWSGLIRRDLDSFAQAGVLLIGLLATMVGFARGVLAARLFGSPPPP
jgi:glycosyltransferase involved in cell wall biosynthesis